MSIHSYSRCWLHLVWATLDRHKVLHKDARVRVSEYLSEYARSRNIYMKINYVNVDHVHALIDLPTNTSIGDVVKLFKGSSSYWINQNRVITGKFSWGRGYGAFSVSQSNVPAVAIYITDQG